MMMRFLHQTKCSSLNLSIARRLLVNVRKVGPVEQEQEISQLLKDICEPITNRGIGNLGCIQKISVSSDNEVKVLIDTFVPGYPFRQEIKKECEDRLRSLKWVRNFHLEFAEKILASATADSPTSSATFSPLSKIHHIIGVSSCKGGVGKSTVAVNLACALAMKPGLRVGILDADVYGPSLPIQLKPTDSKVKRSPINPQKFILPLISKELSNLKMLSFGFVNPNSGAPGSGGKSAALMRGPMASKVINQMLLATDWGELDYLIVDMPPGTGDVQLTLSQTLSFSGAVIVTTPHLLSLVDAAKGVEMFRAVNVPTLSFVENMSFFTGNDGQRYHPFGLGGKEALLKTLLSPDTTSVTSVEDIQRDIESVPYFSLPLCLEGAGMTLNSQNEQKLLDSPLIISCPQSESAAIYHQLSSEVIGQIFKLEVMSQVIPSIFHDRTANGIRVRYFTATEAKEYFLSSKELRSRDPKTGKRIAMEEPAGEQKISKVDMKGSYGVGIVWSDRSDIYPFDIIKAITETMNT